MKTNLQNPEEKAQNFAQFQAKIKQNLHILQIRFLEHLNEDLGHDEDRNEELKEVMDN